MFKQGELMENKETKETKETKVPVEGLKESTVFECTRCKRYKKHVNECPKCGNYVELKDYFVEKK